VPVAERGDSQDFCAGDPVALIGRAPCEGNIVDLSGKVLGRHRGLWFHTVGKRKGLGIGGGRPYYVVRLDAARNEVVVAFREEASVFSFSFREPRWLCEPARVRALSAAGEVFVKTRSAGEPKGPVRLEEGRCFCPSGLMGVAPGQSAVFYRRDEVLGGGIIAS
jgi:tRNA-specific 2-thiouridylase